MTPPIQLFKLAKNVWAPTVVTIAKMVGIWFQTRIIELKVQQILPQIIPVILKEIYIYNIHLIADNVHLDVYAAKIWLL